MATDVFLPEICRRPRPDLKRTRAAVFRSSIPDHDLGVEEEAADERALVSRLDDGAVLLVGEELSGFHGVKRAILIAFAWALAMTIALGLIGGLALSAAFLRRMDAMTTTANGIIAGDLTRRIPSAKADDDLGRLASTFNRMLDRIGALIEANRHVGSTPASPT